MHIQDALGDWSDRPGPLYARLSAALGAAIERGDIPPGTVLPPERSLARRLAIGRNTVTHAYAHLRDRGILETRQGSGSWVAGARRTGEARSPRESLPVAALRNPAALIDLATAALPAHHRLRAAVAALGAADADTAAALDAPGYHPAGLPALRAALAARLTEQGLATDADQVLVTTGDQQALSLLAAHALPDRQPAVVETPTSPGILDVLHGLSVAVRGARPVTSGSDELLALIDRVRPGLVYLVPTLGPHGRVLGADDRARLARALADRDTLVVDDVSQAGLVFDQQPPPLAACAQSDNLVTVGSLSKLHWGGLRIGWVRGSAPLVAALGRAKARADLGTPVLDQVLATRLLPVEDDVRAERVAVLRDQLSHASAALTAALPEFRWLPPDGGLSLWLRLPTGTATAFSEVSARFGVAVVPGGVLSPDGLADDHVRVVYARPPQVFDEGLRRLAAAWVRYRHATDDQPVLL
ncbi:aminotransferase-like domain-containing protein [Goodfellowiella coeruleoviolacea]|uniref:DNA-binding transcriptional regulator, MocR family, contains an aminotransferase domain n=1 Tax=Goodfellowiella coeruleoviolacea TaxID=334858 RepID=A0AAE3GBM8_9PSEU|nr:PLP-dependent aminotransferase family protein [Goodfellowiella coeruleoviolacea]MCP2163183.1 DNA-binding transcriptional regulator, MocR family, contains an aminotransferase domain [Goodfellowiella coeruleoviolacea]